MFRNTICELPLGRSVRKGAWLQVEQMEMRATPSAGPTISSPGAQTSDEGTAVSIDIQASDPDDGDIVLFEAYSLPPGLQAQQIAPGTLRISGTFDYTAASGGTPTIYTVELYAMDDQNETTTISFGWTVNDVNRPPVITSYGEPADWLFVEGQEVSILVTATDPDGDALTFSADDLPPGLSISAYGPDMQGERITASPKRRRC